MHSNKDFIFHGLWIVWKNLCVKSVICVTVLFIKNVTTALFTELLYLQNTM